MREKVTHGFLNALKNMLKCFEKYAMIVRNVLTKPFEDFQKYLKISQQFVFFIQTREKLTHSLLKQYEKYAQIVHF